MNCKDRPKVTGFILTPEPEQITLNAQQKAQLLNLRRLWKAHRRQFGRSETLCEDFTQLANRILTKHGLRPSKQFIEREILQH